MNSQRTSNDISNQPSVSPTNLSPREQRRAERHQRRAERFGTGGGAWIGGVIFIAIGTLLLLQNTGVMLAGNWWALFILLPAIGSFGAAWNEYQKNEQMSGRIISAFIAGIFFTGLAFALYFDFDLTWAGPVALILLGIGVLAAALFRPVSQ